MKGKIDKYGNLYIERGDKMKSQSCPFKEKRERDYFEKCNDKCPLFGEPKLEIDGKSAIIEICDGKTLFLDQFTDERVGGEE